MASTTSLAMSSSSALGIERPDLPERPAYHLKLTPSVSWPSLLRLSIAVIASTGILTCFPSTTPFGLVLGVD